MNTSGGLLGKFPVCWRPFLRALTAQQSNAKLLENFLPGRLNLETVTDNKEYTVVTNLPDWHGLLQTLSDKEPILREGILHFSPRFALLSSHSRRTLLMFLEKHKEELPIIMLKTFLQVIKEAGLTDDWCKMYHHLLNIHILCKQTSSSCLYSGGFVSAKSVDMFEKVCQQIKSGSKNHSYVNCQPQGSWLTNAFGNIPKSSNLDENRIIFSGQEQVSQRIKRKSDDSNAFDSVTPFMKKPKVELSADEIFPEVGAAVDTEEVSRVCSQVQMKSEDRSEDSPQESTWDESHKLMYGPLQEVLHAQKVSWTPELTELLKTFVTVPLREFEAGCNEMEMKSLSLPSLVALCHQVTSLPLNHISFTTSKHLAKCLFIKKISELNQAAPRNLLLALSHFGRVFSKALVEGCLIPFLHDEDLGPHQTDLLLKVFKDGLGDVERVLLLRGFLQKQHLKWSEHVTAFLQGILNTKVNLDVEVLDEVIRVLREHASSQQKCPKFAKLILAVINKFHKQLTSGHKAELQSVTETNETFLKNAMNSALKKCMM